jgi:Tol biopolymer transport system component
MLALSRVYYGEGQLQLLFLDVATMKIHRHGTIDGGVWSASWSPDGKKMAIATDSKVYVANAAGSDLEVVLPYPVWELAWAPDGQKIAVITVECPWDCYGADIALLDPTTKALTVLERGPGGFNSITWSADGNSLAYSAWVTGAGMRDVRIMSVANGQRNVVLTNAADPSWRP